MLLVFYAFPREVALLKRRLTGVTPLERGLPLNGFRAAAEGFGEAVFVATGIGPVRAREAARRALSIFPEARFAIGTGVAGALSSGLRPGDIVIADRVLSARDEEGAVPERAIPIAARERLHCERVLREAGFAFSTGAILTSHRALPDSGAKRAAAAETGAIAVDMESAALALETASRGVPFAVVRAIMDAAEDEVFGAEISGPDGRVRPLAAAAYFAANPRALVGVPRIMRDLGRAARALAGAVVALSAAPAPGG